MHTHSLSRGQLTRCVVTLLQDAAGAPILRLGDHIGGGDDAVSWKEDPLYSSLKTDLAQANITFKKLPLLAELLTIIKTFNNRALAPWHAQTGAEKSGIHPFRPHFIIQNTKQYETISAEDVQHLVTAYPLLVAIMVDVGFITEAQYDTHNVVKDRDAAAGLVRDALTWCRHRAEICSCAGARADRAGKKLRLEEAEAANVARIAQAVVEREAEDERKAAAKREKEAGRARKEEESRARGEAIAVLFIRHRWVVEAVWKDPVGKKKRTGAALQDLARFLGKDPKFDRGEDAEDAGGGGGGGKGSALFLAGMRALAPFFVEFAKATEKVKRKRKRAPAAGEDERSCVCEKPDKGCMVGCEGGCEGWSHHTCASMSEEEANDKDRAPYICKSCAKHIEEELARVKYVPLPEDGDDDDL